MHSARHRRRPDKPDVRNRRNCAASLSRLASFIHSESSFGETNCSRVITRVVRLKVISLINSVGAQCSLQLPKLIPVLSAFTDTLQPVRSFRSFFLRSFVRSIHQKPFSIPRRTQPTLTHSSRRRKSKVFKSFQKFSCSTAGFVAITLFFSDCHSSSKCILIAPLSPRIPKKSNKTTAIAPRSYSSSSLCAASIIEL